MQLLRKEVSEEAAVETHFLRKEVSEEAAVDTQLLGRRR
jgi:hypothetical protein